MGQVYHSPAPLDQTGIAALALLPPSRDADGMAKHPWPVVSHGDSAAVVEGHPYMTRLRSSQRYRIGANDRRCHLLRGDWF
jgi:hypothetical protein